jgi:hypothetical protein
MYLKLQSENCKRNCQNEVNLGFLEGNSTRGVVVAVFLFVQHLLGFRPTGKSSVSKKSTSHSLAGGVRLSYGLGAISSA